jgi:hypothetical protein
MDRVTRALDHCLAQVAAGSSPDAALAAIADADLRREVAGLLAAAQELSTGSFGRPRPEFRAGLAGYLAELELPDAQPSATVPLARLARPLVAGAVLLAAILAGMGGWTLRGAATLPGERTQSTALMPPQPTLPPTAIARQLPVPEPDLIPAPNAVRASGTTPRPPSAMAFGRATTVVPPLSATAAPTTAAPTTQVPTISATSDTASSSAATPLAGGPPSASPEPTVVISGLVLADSVPLAEVRVVALRSERGAECPDPRAREVDQTLTDADGRYRLAGLSPGDYRIFAEGGPSCLPRRWHVQELAEGAAEPCMATGMDLSAVPEIGFVNIRFVAVGNFSCPTPPP